LHPKLEKWFWIKFISRLDGFIALSAQGLELARQSHPCLASLPGFVIPHGHYRGEYPNDNTHDAREILGIDPRSTVTLFFGQIRPYKNVSSLVSAFRALQGDNKVLLIVGEPLNVQLADQLRILAGSDHRVKFHFRHVPNDEVQNYLRAANLVVLPYREMLNSGSALLALSFDRPVLVAEKGAMSELATCIGHEWVRTFSGELSPDELQKALDWASSGAHGKEAPLSGLDWSEISAKTEDAFRRIALDRRSPLAQQ
jgi:glycosyltransferase involved in cell wall biosynthesis